MRVACVMPCTEIRAPRLGAPGASARSTGPGRSCAGSGGASWPSAECAWQSGSSHHLSAKHLPAYVDEMEWRFNNRANGFLFRDTYLALLEKKALPSQDLTASEAA